MNTIKKILSVLLALLLLFSFTACKRDSAEDDTTEPTGTLLEQANALIEKGKYTAAYELLCDLDAPSAEEAALLSCFKFLPVEEVKETSNFRGTETTTMTYTYDDRGNLLVQEFSDSNGSWGKTVRTYDDKNNLLSMEYSGSETLLCYKSVYVNTYDTQGNLIQVDCTKASTNPIDQEMDKTPTQTTTLYTYDASGNLLTYDFSASYNYWEKQVNTYDGNKKLSYEASDANGKAEKYLYFYDLTGKLTSMYLLEEGQPATITTYTYDVNGNLLTEEKSDDDGIYSKHTYTYDSNGNLLIDEITKPSGSWWKYVYTYDEKGNLLTKEESHYNGYQLDVVYTYDKNGNQITSTQTDEYETVTTKTTWKVLYNPSYGTEGTETETPTPFGSTLEQAQHYISLGAYEHAYILLNSLESPTEEEIALLSCFKFLPLNKTRKAFSHETIYNYTYDEKGNVLTKEKINPDGTWTKYSYTYDDDGNITLEEYTNSLELWSKLFHFYDDKGNKLKTEYTDSTNVLFDLLNKYEYTYDEKGNVLTAHSYKREIERDPNAPEGATVGNYIWTETEWRKYTYIYDGEGNILTKDLSYSDGDWKKYVYTYDDNGNILTEEWLDNDGDGWKYVYTYDDNGNCLSSYFTYDDEGWSKTVYTYDEKGNMLTEEHSGSATSGWKNVYTYDEKGNLLTMSKSNGDITRYTYDLFGVLVCETTENGIIENETVKITSKLFYNPRFAEETEK